MRYVKTVAIVIAIAIALGILGISAGCVPLDDAKDEGNIEYRTDILPIRNRFPDLPEFTTCYWKADMIGHIYFGPTSYWMRGFVCLDEKEFQQVLADYVWKEESIVFPTGIDPSITGKSNFRWHSNAEFESLILQQNFVGIVLLDVNNGILYFSVENM
ncbi:MAG: hypothetical protein GX592_05460 [Clostridiales bacterium]|nr:hypothetical protein [Clostridiales bacterium]